MGLTKPRAAQIYNLDYKQATRVVTVANITLAGGAPNQVDGVNLSLKDRILVTGQDTASQNGLYYVTTLGSGSNGTWTRTGDADSTGEIEAGMIIMVTEGTTYADTQWKLTTNDPITIGSTALTFVQNYSANSISSGNSNVIVYNNSAVTISSAGVSNVLSVGNTAVIITGNLNPSANVTYSLGNTTNRWKDLWLSNSTIYLGNITLGATATLLTVNGSSVVTSSANADIQTAGNISATGNISGNYLFGNGSQITGIVVSAGAAITNGNSNVSVSANSNVAIAVAGTPDIAVFASTGEYVTGVISATGNIIGSYIIGNGSQLTGLPAGYANSDVASYLASGTVSTDIKTTSLISATGNVTGGNILTAGLMSSTGNATHGNILTAGLVSATGNVTGNYIFGNGVSLTGVITSVANINSGTSNVTVVSSGGNVSVGVGGTSNVAVFATTGEYVTGVISATGNITGGNILTSGLISVTGSSQAASYSTAGNVTGGNILTGGLITATGNVTGGNFRTAGLITATGNITGGNLIQNGLRVINWTTVANTAPTGAVPGDFWYDSYTGVKYQYTNDGTANYWVDQSYPTSFSTLAVTGAATIGTTLNVTGNTTAGNFLTSGIVSATGNITGNYFFGNGSQLTGIDATSIQSGTSNVKVVSSGGNVSIGIAGNNIITITAAGIINNQANGVGNIGNSTGYFNTAFVKATSAQYADLAEYYVTDYPYPPGTVLVFGGTAEVTVSDQSHDTRTAGVVSTDPAYIMNATASGLTVPVALTGRVPCQVQGPVNKGDRLVNIQRGVAGRLDLNLYQPGSIIGKSLEDITDNSVKTIEIAVGRY